MSALDNQLVNIISVSPTAIAVVDLEMRYIAASRKWVEDYNLLHEKLIGRSHYDLFPEIGAEWKAIHAECLKGKPQKNPRDKFTRLDGTVQWLSWDVMPWMDNNGMIGGMIMSSEDITDRMVGEIELKRSIDLFNETNEAARIGSWELDTFAGTVYWSQIVKKIYEVKDDFIPGISSIKQFYKAGNDADLVEKMIFSAQNEGKSFDEDLEIITAKGKLQWIRFRGNPHFKHGKCVRISGTIQDIQELKMQSLMLRDSEEKYKSILENSLNPHFLIRMDGHIMEANKAALDMFGYTIEEMRTLNRDDIMDTSDPALAAYLKKREETGSARAELTGIRKNGKRFLIEISSVFFTDSNGVQRTSVSIVDITER
ncbi:MAG: PAS domain S-box protein, partial [Daejeonella sp.]